MTNHFQGRDFLTLKDFSANEISTLLTLSARLKNKKQQGIKDNLLQGKNIVLLFEKDSTRTRCAFEVAAYDEGANVTYLANSHMGKKESIEDTAKVLSRFYDGIEFRGFKHETVQHLALHASVPVWNGLTDTYHPTQILADFLTLQEKVNKPLHKIKFVYVGDARNNMGNSLMIGAAKMGIHFVGLAPKSLHPSSDLIKEMQVEAKRSGATIEFHDDIETAVKDADALYTDVWVSMGEEDQYAKRIELLKKYQVNHEMIDATHNPNVIFMHCLPAFHDTHTETAQKIKEKFGLVEMEVTDQVFRSKHSVVFDQAENRLHTIKAVMVATLCDKVNI